MVGNTSSIGPFDTVAGNFSTDNAFGAGFFEALDSLAGDFLVGDAFFSDFFEAIDFLVDLDTFLAFCVVVVSVRIAKGFWLISLFV